MGKRSGGKQLVWIRLRRFFRWWKNPADRFSFFLVIATSVGVFVAALQWNELHATDKTLNDTLMANTRAWVAPQGAMFDGEITVGSNLRLKVLLQNVGKEPALNLVHFRAPAPIIFPIEYDAKQMPYIDFHNVPWPKNITCNFPIEKIRDGRTVYPGVEYSELYYIFNSGPKFLPQRFADKLDGLIIYGCFYYESFGQVRKSPYCYYTLPSRELPMKSARFEPCMSGDAPAT